MKNDFITIYKKLEEAEQEDFKNYISFFYKQFKTVLNTFKKVLKLITENKDDELLELIENNKKILNDLSDLKKWLLEFITLQEVKEANSYEARILTLDALRKRNIKPILAQKTEQLNKKLSNDSSLNMWQSFMKLWLDHNAYYNADNDKLKDFQIDIQQLIENFDKFYVAHKLKYCAELAQRANIVQEKYQPYLLNEILVSIENNASLNPIIHELYVPLIELGRDKSETAYRKLKQFLLNNPAHDRNEKLSILLYLLNFATQKNRQGDAKFNIEFFDLVEKIGLPQSLFTAAGYFPTTSFTNIVNVSNTLKKYDWATQFIDDWCMYLKPEDKEIATNLARARTLFGKNDFEAARKLLELKIKHQNISFILNIRILLAQVYYEQKQLDSVQESHIDNLYQYVYRHKVIGKAIKDSTTNFVKVLGSLIAKKSQEQLLQELEQKKTSIYCFEWLQEKVNDSKG